MVEYAHVFLSLNVLSFMIRAEGRGSVGTSPRTRDYRGRRNTLGQCDFKPYYTTGKQWKLLH
jgi:hypothetical protein